MNKLPILLTASVSTRGMVGADFSNATREKMYLESLKFYCDGILAADKERRLIFAENSGWDLEKFKCNIPSQLISQIEFISVDPKFFDISRGKGYNEIILINKAIELSDSIREAHAFMKVTGRYPVYNIARYLNKAEDFIFNTGGKFYGDIKDHKVYDFLFPHNTAKWNGHAAYTVLFATSVDFYCKNLAPLYSECNDYQGRWIECVWYDVLSKYRGMHDSGVSLRFDREPVCGGLQGSAAQTIAFSKQNQSLKSRIMRFAGNCIRVLLPSFWF